MDKCKTTHKSVEVNKAILAVQVFACGDDYFGSVHELYFVAAGWQAASDNIN